MYVEVLVAKLLLSLFWVIPPGYALLDGPPRLGSWWYPDFNRWDYRFKLSLFAFLMIGDGSKPEWRFCWIIVAMGLLMIWLAPVTSCG